MLRYRAPCISCAAIRWLRVCTTPPGLLSYGRASLCLIMITSHQSLNRQSSMNNKTQKKARTHSALYRDDPSESCHNQRDLGPANIYCTCVLSGLVMVNVGRRPILFHGSLAG